MMCTRLSFNTLRFKDLKRRRHISRAVDGGQRWVLPRKWRCDGQTGGVVVPGVRNIARVDQAVVVLVENRKVDVIGTGIARNIDRVSIRTHNWGSNARAIDRIRVLVVE